MKKVAILAVLVVACCVACAKPVRFPGAYDRHNRVYVNDTIGFRLLFPRHWAVTADSWHFTVPVFLRDDQEQLLEAYDLASRLGLVVVAQEGPLLEIDELVRRMQAMPLAQVNEHLRRPQAVGVQQTVQKLVINGRSVAEWVYTATDTTGWQPVELTIYSYIYKLGSYYVYLTFSIPVAQEANVQPTIKSIVDSLQPVAPKRAIEGG